MICFRNKKFMKGNFIVKISYLEKCDHIPLSYRVSFSIGSQKRMEPNAA